MRCVFCSDYEASTTADGKRRIHEPGSFRGKPIEAILCSTCSIILSAQGYQDIPWGGKEELKERISSRVRTRKERKRLEG